MKNDYAFYVGVIFLGMGTGAAHFGTWATVLLTWGVILIAMGTRR